ncbi:MAG TPA: hypothetical protein PLW86_08590 [Rhodocyclaceae bacterium]|nr:hypothetical protein [Rhodocyclaceae bacterium]
MSTVYAKTAKGQNEVDSRAGGLKPKTRRVLILIDSKRDIDELARLSLNDEDSVTEILRNLLVEGYIELAATPMAAGTLPPATSGHADDENEFVPASPPPAAPITQAKNPGNNLPPPDPFGGILKI